MQRDLFVRITSHIHMCYGGYEVPCVTYLPLLFYLKIECVGKQKCIYDTHHYSYSTSHTPLRGAGNYVRAMRKNGGAGGGGNEGE